MSIGDQYPFFYGAKRRIFEYADTLRTNSTPSEKILWQHLKGKRLMGLKFRRQHPANQFILDFYCHEIRLVIELDGSIHDLPERKEYDKGRQYCLEEFGLTVIRFRNEEINSNLPEVLQKIKKLIKELKLKN